MCQQCRYEKEFFRAALGAIPLPSVFTTCPFELLNYSHDNNIPWPDRITVARRGIRDQSHGSEDTFRMGLRNLVTGILQFDQLRVSDRSLKSIRVVCRRYDHVTVASDDYSLNPYFRIMAAYFLEIFIQGVFI